MQLSLTKKGNLKVNNRNINEYPLEYINDLVRSKLPDPVTKTRSVQKPGELLILIRAGTAAGKSSLIPKILYEKLYEIVRRNIIVSEPRVITTESIPKEIARYNREMILGKNIGYKTGSFKGHIGVRGILFMTHGILLLMLLGGFEKFMDRCSILIVDEIHEQDSNLVLSLVLIKKLLNEHYKNPKCPVVIFMSATFDPELYMMHYNVPKSNFLDIAGLQSHPIKDIFTPHTITNVLDYAFYKAMEVHLKNQDDYKTGVQDIILFTKSNFEIDYIDRKIAKFNREVYEDADLSYYYDDPTFKFKYKPKTGGESKKPYIKSIKFSRVVFSKKENILQIVNIPISEITESLFDNSVSVVPIRRIIITTPIIETGFTAREAKYVIDTGFSKQVIFNPEINQSFEYGANINNNMAVQRRGRVGRRAPGVFLPCYTKKTFDLLPKQNYSRFLCEDITESVLGIIVKESKSFVSVKSGFFAGDKIINFEPEPIDFSKQVDFIEYPSAESLCLAFEKLYILGFMDEAGVPTKLGAYAFSMKKLPVECRKMILAGFAHGAYIYDLITIACFIASEISVGKEFCQYVKGENFWYDDHIDFLLFWYEFTEKIEKVFSAKSVSIADLSDWCKKRGFDYKSLLKISVLKNEIMLELAKLRLNMFYNSLNIEKGSYSLMDFVTTDKKTAIQEIRKIKRCIYDGYKMNLVTLKESKYYTYRDQPVSLSSRTATLAFETGYWIKYCVAVSLKTVEKKYGLKSLAGSISVLDGFFNPDITFIAS